MPNAFNPDGGNVAERRMNSFGPNNWGLEIEDFRIYNRWGEQVFIKGDDGYRWDGNLNGKPQPQGVYVYFIKAKCPNSNKTITKQGNVTLLR